MDVNHFGFVDKAVSNVYKDVRNHSTDVQLYVKVGNIDELDGPVAEVGYKGTALRYANGVYAGNQSFNIQAHPFVGAKDYFELPPIGVAGGDRNAGSGAAKYVGELYVKTTKGTEYPIVPMGGGPLVVDEFLADTIPTKNNPGPVSWNPVRADVGSIPKTADLPGWPSAAAYLNPDGDR